MASSLIGWIWKQEIGATAKLVLFALNEHTNIGEHGDWRVYPGQDRIAKMCGMSKRSVIRAMQELTELGVIVVAQQHDAKGRQLQNLYWLQAPKLILEEGCQNVTPQCLSVTHGGDKLSHNHSYKNPLKKTKEKTSRPKNKFSDEHLACAEYFASAPEIRKQPNAKKWANTIRLMVERDNVTLDEIRSLWDWTRGDDFWSGTCLSPESLRKNWNQLEAKSRQTQTKRNSNHGYY